MKIIGMICRIKQFLINKIFSFRYTQLNDGELNDVLLRSLQNNDAFSLGRLGNTEMSIVNFIDTSGINELSKNRIAIPYTLISFAKINAGIYGKNMADYFLFTSTYKESVKNIKYFAMYDFIPGEKKLLLKKGVKIEATSPANILEPMRYIGKGKMPWSFGLKAKKVLVIHPFSKTIEQQYLKRSKLFSNTFILPPFQLITYKPVQTSGTVIPGNDSWSVSLNNMIDDIKKLDFDVALVGAGAYALPLVSYIANLDRTAILMGSAIQCLFGIRGKRWDENGFGQLWYNDYWCYADIDEIPQGADLIEGGCYWK